MKTRLFILLLFGLSLLALTRPGSGLSGTFVISGADGVLDLDTGANPNLPEAAARFVVTAANHMLYLPLAAPPISLDVADRIVLHAANGTSLITTTYPVTLINDQSPPQVSAVQRSSQQPLLVTWSTDEFTSSEIQYGTQPGSLTLSVQDDLFSKTHALTLTGVPADADIYLVIRSVDRSGNQTSTPEMKFSAVHPIYLPYIRR